MAKLDPPRLSIGGLSGRVFVTTHGKILGHDDEGRELIESSVKYDVTEQIEALLAEFSHSSQSAEKAQINQTEETR